MADNEKILAALARLDHGNDDHWLDDGAPKTGIVQRLADDQTIRRQDIEAAAPGFRRRGETVEQVEQDEQVEPSVSDGQPPLSVAEAQQRLVESQVRLRLAHDRQRDARARVGRALAGWQQVIGNRYTPEMAAREFIASSIADRAAGGSRRPRNQPGPSIVDRMAFGHGRNINIGKYGAWRRGAMSISESTRRLNETARTAKLPSER